MRRITARRNWHELRRRKTFRLEIRNGEQTLLSFTGRFDTPHVQLLLVAEIVIDGGHGTARRCANSRTVAELPLLANISPATSISRSAVVLSAASVMHPTSEN